MSHTLVSYHINPYKLGQVIRQYAKDRDVSQASLAAQTGLSYDTVGNIYAGKVQKIPFEYLFKICVVLAIPVEVIVMLMIKDEDIDFAQKVLLYSPDRDKPVPAAVAVPTLIPGTVPDAVADTAVAVAAAAPVLEAVSVNAEAGHTYYTAEDIELAVRKVKTDYEARIADLKEAYDKERETSAKHFEQMHQLAMGVISLR